MSELVYDKKIIVTFNSYEHMFKHMDDHENYHDLMLEQADALGMDSVDSYDHLLWQTSWWVEQNLIDCDLNDFPVWTPELDGKVIRAEILVPSQVLPFLLDRIDATAQQVGQGPDHIEVVDNV